MGGTPEPGLRPVFIGGCDRSGTTLLGATIGAELGAVVLPESQFVGEWAGRLRPNEAADRVAAPIARHRRYPAWREAGCSEPSAVVRPGDTLSRAVERLVRHYADATGWDAPTHFVDHSPQNIHFMGALRRHFPDALFIHIVRDGRAVAESLLRMDWGPVDIVEASRKWNRSVGAGFAAVHRSGRTHAMTVAYEELVSNRSKVVAQLRTFMGLDAVDGEAQRKAFRVPLSHRDTHAIVNGAPDPGRIAAWRDRLSSRDIELFEQSSGDILRALGYELVTDPARTAAPTLREKIVHFATRPARRQVQRRRFAARHGEETRPA